MGSLVETIAKIGFGDDAGAAPVTCSGRTYEYFIKEFARAEGHRGGEFYTPAPVTRLLVEMLEPYEGRVLDPACGSCGLFVQSAPSSSRLTAGSPKQISIYGQERQPGHLAHRPHEPRDPRHLGRRKYTEGGSLLDDKFPTCEGRLRDGQSAVQPDGVVTPAILDDARWAHGEPPDGNANYAWIQHFLYPPGS